MSVVQLDLRDSVLVVTLNRPETLNALSHELVTEFARAVARAREQSEVSAIVVTGSGRGFCSGGDVSVMASTKDPDELESRMRRNAALFGALRSLPKPTVAAVNGPAVGAGFSLAMSCDAIVAAESAFFAQAFLDRGLVPDLGSSYLLVRQVGIARAKHLCYSGGRIGAEEAFECGLVSQLVANEAVVDAAVALAAAWGRRPQPAFGLTKALLQSASEVGYGAAVEAEIAAQRIAAASPAHREAVQRFAVKRKEGD